MEMKQNKIEQIYPTLHFIYVFSQIWEINKYIHIYVNMYEFTYLYLLPRYIYINPLYWISKKFLKAKKGERVTT